MNAIKCKICKKSFKPNRTWQVYCSAKCREKGKIKNATTWRENKPLKMKKLTVRDIKFKEKYKKVYEKIIDAFKPWEITKEGFSWTELYKKSGLKDRATFNIFIDTLCNLDMLKKDNGRYFPNQRYKFEPLRLRVNALLANTPIDYGFFVPSPGFSYYCYNPNIKTEDILYNVDDLKTRLKPFENLLKKAQKEWFHILNDARDNYLSKFWNKEVLNKSEMNSLTKFIFAIDMILDLNEIMLYSVSSSEKTLNEQSDILEKIKEKALKKYVQRKYSKFSSFQLKEFLEEAEKQYRINNNFFTWISKMIRANYRASKLESIIVIDFLTIGNHGKDSFKDAGLYNSVTLDGDRPIGEIKDELNKLSSRNLEHLKLETLYSLLEQKTSSRVKKIFTKTPFFKSFFQGFEKDLLVLGFHRGKDFKSLESFYIALDKTADIINIPILDL